jgi:SWI/SNF-related matrix-associated actin-dependent regulator 1 of chromatin subfamily A
MTTQLFPYQIDGARFLAQKSRALLADEMGLGKSAQAIAACDELKAATVMVVCPASVVENWKREINRFKKGRWDSIVVSYDRARRLDEDFHNLDVLVLDEAHYLKTRTAKRTKAIFGDKCDGKGGLVERAKHVFCLTGTPTPNNPSELWPMLRAVMPDAITAENSKPASYWGFVSQYCYTRDNGFGVEIVKGKNLDKLKERIAPFVLRRKKTEVLKDLPPITFDELPLTSADALKALKGYDTEIARIRQALEKKGVDGLTEVAAHVASLRRVIGLSKVGLVVDWVGEWLEAGGKKLVLFAYHRDVIAQLQNAFGPLAVSVTGSTHSEDRQRCVDEFQEGHASIFTGQITAAGTGITLTAASDLLFVESSWVPAENEQAAMRIHRIGQKNACLVRFATLAGSLDEDIQRACMRKAADIAKLFG